MQAPGKLKKDIALPYRKKDPAGLETHRNRKKGPPGPSKSTKLPRNRLARRVPRPRRAPKQT